MMLRCHTYFPKPTTGAVGALTVGGRVCWMAFSRICMAILSKSSEVMAPESLEKKDFTFSMVDAAPADPAIRGRSRERSEYRAFLGKTIRPVP